MSRPSSASRWHDVLQCDLLRAEFDYVTRHVGIVVPPDHCTDMLGAIEFAHDAMWDVEIITVYEGPARGSGIQYQLDGRTWTSRQFRNH